MAVSAQGCLTLSEQTISMNSTLYRLWHSPTLMTWGNQGVRLAGFAILLPLVLNRLTVEEASLWLLFQALLLLQRMADFGFTPTFVRIVSYARAGKTPQGNSNPAASWGEGDQSMRRVLGTMRFVYNRLSLGVFLLFAIIGSLAVMRPISQIAEVSTGWLAWLVIVLCSVLVFRGGMFGAYMRGVNKIALYQRWQTVTGMATIMAAIVVLLFDGGLLGLVAVAQLGAVIGIIVTRWLANQDAPEGSWTERIIRDTDVLQTIWPAAWRSGLGVVMAFGTIQGAGVIYAQIALPADAAAFLLAQRIVQTLASFANAPFYTRIPHMARMYAEGRYGDLVECAKTGMIRTNWLLISGIIFVGITGPHLLTTIGSQTSFVDKQVWWLLGLAVLLERIGAMHLQLYSVKNHIVWHIANGVTGVIMIIAMLVSYNKIGLLGLPLGMVIAYTCFYVPYC